MLGIYYKIWVDGITQLRSRPENKGMWKFYAITFMTMAMAINLLLIMAILQRNILKNSFYDIHFHVFPGERLNQFLSFFVLYFLIPLLINYTLIFRNNRYEKLIPKYKSHGGKLYATYTIASLFLPFVLLIFAYLFEKL